MDINQIHSAEVPERITAIDMHTHFNRGSRYDTKETEIYTADLTKLQEINQAAGVTKMFCTTFSSVLSPATITADNDYLFDLSLEMENIYQWVVLDPKNEKTFRQAKTMLRSPKCVGIKLHPLHHNYSLADYSREILSFAADHHAVILIHPEDDPHYILPYADTYPDVTFIIAHLGSYGGSPYTDVITHAKHRNVYTDTSGIASTWNQVIEYTVSQVGSDHILFGTDTYAASFQRGRIEYACISDTDKENILRRNSERLFGLKA